MSIDPLIAASLIVAETDRIRAELVALRDSLQGGRPTRAMAARVKELRKRAQALDAEAEGLLLRELGLQIAVRQRLGRTDVEGEVITAVDEAAAEKILADLRLC